MSFVQREIDKVRGWPAWLKVVAAALCLVVAINMIAVVAGMDRGEARQSRSSTSTQTDSSAEPIRNAVETWSMQVAGRVADCQRGIRGFAPAFEDIEANAQRGFEEATQSALVCRAVTAGMERADKPDVLSRGVVEHMRRVEDDCELVTRWSQEGAEAAARLFDGSYRPSTITEIRRNFERANQQSDRCLSGINDVREQAGIGRLD